jgi:hypothetical protein
LLRQVHSISDTSDTHAIVVHTLIAYKVSAEWNNSDIQLSDVESARAAASFYCIPLHIVTESVCRSFLLSVLALLIDSYTLQALWLRYSSAFAQS